MARAASREFMLGVQVHTDGVGSWRMEVLRMEPGDRHVRLAWLDAGSEPDVGLRWLASKLLEGARQVALDVELGRPLE